MKKLLTLLLFALTTKAQLYRQDTTFLMGSIFDTVAAVPEQALLVGNNHLFLDRAGNLINGKPNDFPRVALSLNSPETPPVDLISPALGEYAVGFGLRTKSFVYQDKHMYENGVSYFQIDRLHADGSRDMSFNLPKTKGFAFRLFEGPNNELFVSVNVDEKGLNIFHFAANGNFKRQIKWDYDTANHSPSDVMSMLFTSQKQLFFLLRNTQGNYKIIRSDYDLKKRLDFVEFPQNNTGTYCFKEKANRIYLFSYATTYTSFPQATFERTATLNVFDTDGKLLKITEPVSVNQDISLLDEVRSLLTENDEFHIVGFPHKLIRLRLATGELLATPATDSVTILDSYPNGDFLVSKNGELSRYQPATEQQTSLAFSLKNKRTFFPAKVLVQPNGSKLIEYGLTVPKNYENFPFIGENRVRIYDAAGQLTFDFKPTVEGSFFDLKVEKSDRYFKIADRTKTLIIDSAGKVDTISFDSMDAYWGQMLDKNSLLVYKLEENDLVRNLVVERRALDGTLTDSYSIKLKNANQANYRIVISKETERGLLFEYVPNNSSQSINALHVFDLKNGKILYSENNPDVGEVLRKHQYAYYYLETGSFIGSDLFLATNFVGEFPYQWQMVLRLNEKGTPYATFPPLYMNGGKFRKIHGNGLLLSACKLYDYECEYNLLKITPEGKPDTTLAVDYPDPIINFDFNEPQTLYAVSNGQVLRFYATPMPSGYVVCSAAVKDTTKTITANEKALPDLLPYPNPASGRVYVPLAAGENVTDVELIEVNGGAISVVYHIDNKVLTVKLPPNLNGKYFLRITDDNGKSRSHALVIW